MTRPAHHKLYELAVTDATLSGGAHLKSASGDLPQRITSEDDLIFNGLPGASGGSQLAVLHHNAP